MTMAYVVVAVLVAVIVASAAFTLLLQRSHERDRGEWRSERERLLRAALARNTGEFATLERIHNAEVAAAAPRPTPEEFAARERDLLERMGMNGDAVPRVPEGM